jgi:hypothetical protein
VHALQQQPPRQQQKGDVHDDLEEEKCPAPARQDVHQRKRQ